MFGDRARDRRFVGGSTVALFALSAGCSLFGSNKQYDDDDDDNAGGGGTKSSGGTKSNGGSSNGGSSNAGTGGDNLGGSVSTGGTTSASGGTTGGSHSSGGTNSAGGTTGGTLAAGGSTGGDFSASGGDFSAAGGSLSTGGSSATGGSTSTGGSGGTGGSTGGKGGSSSGGTGGSTGGTGGTSGSSGSAGSSGDCGSGFQTHAGGYVTSSGTSGCWHGFAYTVTDTLGSTASPADFSACTDTSCSICSSGTVVADAGYSGWAGLGVDINQADTEDAPTGTVVPTGAGLSVSFTNTGGSQLRIQIQNDTTQWCYTLTGASGTVTVPYTSFNTECWDSSLGVDYAGEALTGVQFAIPGDSLVDTDYAVCLTGFSDH